MRNAIVTGGTRGIGLAITRMLLGRGYNVVATYAHTPTRLTEEMPRAWAGRLQVVRCDQANAADVRDFAERVARQWTDVDALVCNAGTTLRKDIGEFMEDEWNEVMQVNVTSNVFLVKYLMPLLMRNGGQQNEAVRPHRSVVMIGSMMGIHPHGTSLAYGVTKSATHALARNLVKTFEGSGVTVNAIAPGFVETEWQREKPADIRRNICAKTALNRFASVDEIASAVAFCIDNEFVNGSVIEVSGGYSFK